MIAKQQFYDPLEYHESANTVVQYIPTDGLKSEMLCVGVAKGNKRVIYYNRSKVIDGPSVPRKS